MPHLPQGLLAAGGADARRLSDAACAVDRLVKQTWPILPLPRGSGDRHGRGCDRRQRPRWVSRRRSASLVARSPPPLAGPDRSGRGGARPGPCRARSATWWGALQLALALALAAGHAPKRALLALTLAALLAGEVGEVHLHAAHLRRRCHGLGSATCGELKARGDDRLGRGGAGAGRSCRGIVLARQWPHCGAC